MGRSVVEPAPSRTTTSTPNRRRCPPPRAERGADLAAASAPTATHRSATRASAAQRRRRRPARRTVGVGAGHQLGTSNGGCGTTAARTITVPEATYRHGGELSGLTTSPSAYDWTGGVPSRGVTCLNARGTRRLFGPWRAGTDVARPRMVCRPLGSWLVSLSSLAGSACNAPRTRGRPVAGPGNVGTGPPWAESLLVRAHFKQVTPRTRSPSPVHRTRWVTW